MRKKIAFISPIGEGGPKVLYRDLVESLSIKYPDNDYFLVSSSKEWIKLHFYNNKYDLIISSVPFFWKPFNCVYIIQQHGLYRNDRGFSSIPKLLNWLYPFNSYFSKIVLYPSDFLKKYYNSNHKKQKVILNFSTFPIVKNKIINLGNKEEINLLTITGFDFYNKAKGILDIFKKLEYVNINKQFNYYICGSGKYLDKIEKELDNYKIPNNIKIYFLGKLDKLKILELLKKTDIFLYSTFQETFGISIIEAMSFGIPIILNNYKLFNELYNNEFISKSNKDFIYILDRLIKNEEYYNKYLEKGYENLDKFNKERILEEWYKTINKQLI